MTKSNFKNILLLLLIFFTASIISILIEEKYRELIRYLYRNLTYNSISFYGKNFHLFASEYFITSFGLICVFMTLKLKKLTLKQAILKLTFGILLFFFTTIILAYYGSRIKILECTMCDDGKLSINYNDIHYDLIFIISLLIGTIPTLISLLKSKRKKNSINKF